MRILYVYIHLRVVCVATTSSSTFDLLLLWKKLFSANENQQTVKRDMLWPSKRTRQLLGVYLGSCCLFAHCSREKVMPLEGGSLSYASSLVQVYTWLTVIIRVGNQLDFSYR